MRSPVAGFSFIKQYPGFNRQDGVGRRSTMLPALSGGWMKVISFPRSDLPNADLVIDAVYEGARVGNAADDPLAPLLGVGNQGGFRNVGKRERPLLLAITTSMNEPDWPDYLDLETGLFTYYGDNRSPGSDLHTTPRGGNAMLRDMFDGVHAHTPRRADVPPIFVFRNAGTTYRDVRFLGLAVPGGRGIPSTQDLVAVWHHTSGQRFQNYKAVFTILNVLKISRDWIRDIHRGMALTSEAAPAEWKSWVESGQTAPLRSRPTVAYRTKDEQLPSAPDEIRMLEALHRAFRENPHEFEMCAAQIAEMLLPPIVEIDVTRPSRDGGRDAVGKYRIGSEATAIHVDFALEAKCYEPGNPVGVKETSRLISRLRHRQFGILVTTSYVNAQAYKEIRDDSHPVLIVSGRDIVAILKRSAISDEAALNSWLNFKFRAHGFFTST